jgi:hypothetical protein
MDLEILIDTLASPDFSNQFPGLPNLTHRFWDAIRADWTPGKFTNKKRLALFLPGFFKNRPIQSSTGQMTNYRIKAAGYLI